MELNAGLRGTARHPDPPAGAFRCTGAVSGLLSAGLGIAGGLLESALTGPWPDAADPGYAQYLAANRVPILAQSLLFVFSSAALLWFLGFVRARLRCAEPAPGTVSVIAFGAGALAVGLNILGQAAQITLTLPSQGRVPPDVAAAVADLCLVTLNLANLPAGVMFLAIALVSLRLRAYPLWLGWTAAAAAGASFVSVLSLVPVAGPLSPTGGLTTALRLVPLLWYVPAAVVMLRRPATPQAADGKAAG
ncbi:hypothetical protein [Arthrobacter sp. EPSL27]|uniref:hypothetical protein n=1 Tax=Arthrobacter sp. EPSL27 TaxID=1745378 RepID=UPI00074A5AFB|nr:hypothetical protein [Arthrobacter sp. EPSL27]KUM33148.1 hypothetical protein AR539_14330 [Arthrobacter sp. EPSL27]